MRRRTKLIVALMVLVVAGGIAFVGLTLAGGKNVRAVAPPSADQITLLADKALKFGTENGEPNPTNGFVVAASRRAIAELVWPGITVDDQDVYVVTLEGKFTAYGTQIPPDATAPTGTVLIIVYDTSMTTVLDWGLLLTPPDLSQLGPVQPLGI